MSKKTQGKKTRVIVSFPFLSFSSFPEIKKVNKGGVIRPRKGQPFPRTKEPKKRVGNSFRTSWTLHLPRLTRQGVDLFLHIVIVSDKDGVHKHLGRDGSCDLPGAVQGVMVACMEERSVSVGFKRGGHCEGLRKGCGVKKKAEKKKVCMHKGRQAASAFG